MTKVVGVTGLVASGKSTLINYLKTKNFKVFDADYEVSELYLNSIFLEKIKIFFPIAFNEQKLDKKCLANIIFTNKEEKIKLENLIHPIIEKKCDEFIKNNINEKLIFLDIPLLFEVKWDKKCTDIILIKINKQIEKQRFIKRGGNYEMFDKIVQNQYNNEKISKQSYKINNNGMLSDFYQKIDDIVNAIITSD
jgi:dephospho-CoA kinase